MKKVEAFMDPVEFSHQFLRELLTGVCCGPIYSNKENCELDQEDSETPREAKRVYIFDADEYDKQNPSLEKALPLILSLLKDPEFCKEILDKVGADVESIVDFNPIPPTSERFVEITNKVYDGEYDEFIEGYQRATKETKND